MERPQLVVPKGTFQEHFGRALRRNPLPGDFSEVMDISLAASKALKDLEKVFHGIYIETQRESADWAEARFELLREKPEDWSMDGILVDSEARIVLGPWSTYQAYSECRDQGLFISDLVQMMHERYTAGVPHETLFPITPYRDSTLFWWYDDEAAIRRGLEPVFGGDIKVDNYPIHPKLASLMPSALRMTHIPKGKIGTGKFASAGVVSGRLRFWENVNANLAYAGKYIKNVEVDKSRILERQLIVSPLSERGVVVSGGLPMDEKYRLEVVRTDPDLASQDFIAASLIALSHKLSGQPIVLAYNTYRPWLGEYPRHGGVNT